MAEKSSGFGDDLDGYDSSFEDESPEKKEAKRRRVDLIQKDFHQPNATQASSSAIPAKDFFDDQQRRAEGYRNRYFSLNAFERHKKLMNDYFLYFPGAKKLLERDSSKDKRDIDVIRENHRFLWKETDTLDTWEQQLAKAYYDKLYKEYTICDLSRYKENKVAMRWRVEKELLDGKGQFICGAKGCSQTDNLKTWEVNFAYMEDRIKKNALVKLRLCAECSIKLNHGYKRKEVTRSKKRKDRKRSERTRRDKNVPETSDSTTRNAKEDEELEKNIWKAPLPETNEAKPIEEEFDEYLDDLFV